MEEVNKKERKFNKIMLIPIVAILIVLLVATYAWLTKTLSGTKDNIIKAGNLSLILDDKTSKGINSESAIPISDEEGLQTEGYNFRIENNGNLNTRYTIYLDDIEISSGEERMLDESIKYSLTKNESSTTEKLNELTTSKSEIGNKRELENGKIKPNEENNYTLRLWISSDAGEEVINKVFGARISIKAEPMPKWTKTDVDNSGTITVGDKITKGTESFYVISSSGDKVKALAEKNISLTTHLQSDDAETTAFSKSLYWVRYDENGDVIGNSYSEKKLNHTDNLIYSHLKKYKQILESLGAVPNEVRLMDFNSAVDLGCVYAAGDSTCASHSPIWVYSVNYWLTPSSGIDPTKSFAINENGQAPWADPINDSFGIRPVISVDKEDIN